MNKIELTEQFQPSASATGDSMGPRSAIVIEQAVLGALIFDVVASKRVIKTGYVRQPAGLYPGQCDTVAAHCHAISALAVVLAIEFKDRLSEQFGFDLNLEKVACMAVFHDHGEARSGDTGATSHALYGHCKLYQLERQGLESSLKGFRAENMLLGFFDEYRQYRTPESILVHMADNLEGFEKALHSSSNHRIHIETALQSCVENITIYRRRVALGAVSGQVINELLEQLLLPGIRVIANTYGVEEHLVQKYLSLLPAD